MADRLKSRRWWTPWRQDPDGPESLAHVARWTYLFSLPLVVLNGGMIALHFAWGFDAFSQTFACLHSVFLVLAVAHVRRTRARWQRIETMETLGAMRPCEQPHPWLTITCMVPAPHREDPDLPHAGVDPNQHGFALVFWPNTDTKESTT